MGSGLDAEALGAAHEGSLSLQQRRRGGVFYTPPDVAAWLAGQTLGRALDAAPDAAAVRVVDPACGAGALLVAAFRRSIAWHAARGVVVDAGVRAAIARRSLFGVDVDAEAVGVARRAVAAVVDASVDLDANIRCGDAVLEHDARTFEVVLANPPYLDAETMTRAHRALRAACVGRYAAASGNWDLFCVFIERCLQLCAPGGMVGMIVPNKLVSADYARVARAMLVEPGEARLLALRDFQDVPVFAAGVYPLAFVAERGGLQGDVVYERMVGPAEVAWRAVLPAGGFDGAQWTLCSEGVARVVAQIRGAGRPLGELAEVRGAATVAEAYRIAGLIRDGGPGLRIINSGTIDAYEHWWGRKRMRYLGASYLRPVVPDELLKELPGKRLRDARTAKVVVSGMTRGLEAVLDADGALLAGKSTTVVSSASMDLRSVVAQLNSRVVGWYYRQVFGGDRLAGGYLRVGPPQLRQVPVVAEAGAGLVARVEAMVARPDVGLGREIDEIVAAMLGLGPDALAVIDEDVRSRSLDGGGRSGKLEG